jgi:hypothetical protein
MALSPMAESEIIDQVYSLYENDDTTWSSSSSEYLTARRYSKAAIRRWEYLEGVRWPELWTKLSSALDGDKTVTADDYDYTCPTDMRVPPQPGEYVRIGGNYFEIIPLTKVGQMDESTDRFVYFSGNEKTGFTMNVNPKVVLTTGDAIAYEYYRRATYFTSTTSTTEMSNPFFIVHYILSRLYKNDGLMGEANSEMQTAETMLDEMKSEATEIITDTQATESFGFGD